MKKRSTKELDVTFERASKEWDRGHVRSAFRLFLSGAKGGDRNAQQNLGYFYDLGIGVQPNRDKALFWYKRALRSGARSAATNIGTIFRDENQTILALSWFKRAILLADADANLEIAKIYILNDEPLRAVTYLRRTLKGKPKDVPEDSKAEAQRLLDQIQKVNSHTDKDEQLHAQASLQRSVTTKKVRFQKKKFGDR